MNKKKLPLIAALVLTIVLGIANQASAHEGELKAVCEGISYRFDGFANSPGNRVQIFVEYFGKVDIKEIRWNGPHTSDTTPYDFSRGGQVKLSATWNTNGHVGDISPQTFDVSKCVPATTTTTSTTTTTQAPTTTVTTTTVPPQETPECPNGSIFNPATGKCELAVTGKGIWITLLIGAILILGGTWLKIPKAKRL